MSSYWESVASLLYGGIRPDIPGHGGEECASFLPKSTIFLETALSTTMMVIVGIFGALTYTMPKRFPKNDEPASKRFLLVFLCLVFGVEIGYKVSSRQVLYLLNPCHVTTVIEIYLLAAKPGKFSFAVLRTMIHYLYGALVALLLPDTLSRLLPGEVMTYYLQHILIFFVVPPYLIYIWGPDTLEPFTDWSWSCFSGILFGIHNHYILTLVAHLTHVNLNFTLCPSYKDPFYGPYYRTAAVFHCAICLLTLGKIYSLLVKAALRILPSYTPEYTEEAKKTD